MIDSFLLQDNCLRDNLKWKLNAHIEDTYQKHTSKVHIESVWLRLALQSSEILLYKKQLVFFYLFINT